MKISQKSSDELWWMIISVDYDYSRITIAEHELESGFITMWLEDKNDFKNTLDECLQVDIPIDSFKKIIREGHFNSYLGAKMIKNVPCQVWIEIAEPIKWYKDEASPYEQKNVREAVLKALIDNLVDNESKTQF